jgi:RNA polymerase sigma-70 factor (ECF subfamily)
LAQNHTFGEVYEELYDDIWLYCLRRTVSAADAEDMLSETFVTVFEKLGDLDPVRDIRPWVFSIARNKIRNHLKSRRRWARFRHPISLVKEAGLSSSLAAPETLALDESAEVVVAFRRLSFKEQEIISLASWEGLSSREIAVILGCSDTAARSRLHRARKKFAKTLDEMQHIDIRGQVGSEYVG